MPIHNAPLTVLELAYYRQRGKPALAARPNIDSLRKIQGGSPTKDQGGTSKVRSNMAPAVRLLLTNGRERPLAALRVARKPPLKSADADIQDKGATTACRWRPA